MDSREVWFIVGLLSVVVTFAVLATGYILVKRKHKKCTDNGKVTQSSSESATTLNKEYDDYFTLDNETESLNNSTVSQSPMPVIMRIKGRTFWNIYNGYIFSVLIIILFAVAIAIVSALGQKTYSHRKIYEEKTQKAAHTKEKALEQERAIAIEKSISEISRQLDSIDMNIKQLIPIRKTTNSKEVRK